MPHEYAGFCHEIAIILAMRTRLLLFSALFLLLGSPLASAFGVSPASMELNNMLSTSEAELTYVLSDASGKVTSVSVEVEGAGADAFIYEKEVELITNEKGQMEYTYTIAPAGFAPGEYPVRMSFAANGGVLVAPEIQLDMSFAVVEEEIVLLKFHNLDLPEQLPGEALHFTLKLENEGNTAAAPSQLKVNVLDFHNPELSYEWMSEELELVEAYKTQYEEIVTDLELDASFYSMDVTLLDESGEILYSKEGQRFQIMGDSSGNASSNLLPLSFLALFLLFGGLSLYFQRKKS